MANGASWSDLEIAATVADYMRMLTLHLTGQHYNKSAHRRTLMEQLDGRSEGAIELKHQNISAKSSSSAKREKQPWQNESTTCPTPGAMGLATTSCRLKSQGKNDLSR